MKVLSIESIPLSERTNHARQGKFLYHQLLEGDENASDNYSLQLVRTFGDFYSPRHRHNFDQIRVQIEGECDFTRDGTMRTGTVSYFPESTPYGPQKNDGEALVLVLQFGGASGNGYIAEHLYHDAVGELKKTGAFKDGFYTAAGETRGKDAFEAVWEHINGRPIEYAMQRYSTPAFMHPDAFQWTVASGMEGVAFKALGTFTERKVELSLVRLEPGASLPLTGRVLGFVTAGEGKLGDATLTRHTTLELALGESALITAVTELEVFVIGLPPLVNKSETRVARREFAHA